MAAMAKDIHKPFIFIRNGKAWDKHAISEGVLLEFDLHVLNC